jgi:hypothetical protein
VSSTPGKKFPKRQGEAKNDARHHADKYLFIKTVPGTGGVNLRAFT